MSNLKSPFFNHIAQTYLTTLSERRLFSQAIKKMRHSIDPLHDEKHIEAMLVRFELLVKTKRIKLDKISKKLCVLSIAWHDVWISQFNPRWVLTLWYIQMVEGLACARLFLRHATQLRIDPAQAKACAYAIRKHSNYQFFEIKTEIARILYDLDWLEFYSVTRFQKSIEKMKSQGQQFIFERSFLHAFFGILYMKIRAIKPHQFHHDWAREQLVISQKEYFQYVYHFQAEAKKRSYFRILLKYF